MSKAKAAIESQRRAAPRISAHVEQQLQTAYSEVLHEPIPARLLGVLDLLEGGNPVKSAISSRQSSTEMTADAKG